MWEDLGTGPWASRPELDPDAVPYWHAFLELTGSRIQGMGLGGIPWSELAAWLAIHGITDTDRRLEYARYIRVVDEEYLKARNDKRKQEQTAKAAKRK
jgi:hypothetical protein